MITGMEALRKCDMLRPRGSSDYGRHTPSKLHFVRGIHTDPSRRCGGNRFSKLAVRSDDRTAQTRGAFGLQELQPSFPPPLGLDHVHSGRSLIAIFLGDAAQLPSLRPSGFHNLYSGGNIPCQERLLPGGETRKKEMVHKHHLLISITYIPSGKPEWMAGCIPPA